MILFCGIALAWAQQANPAKQPVPAFYPGSRVVGQNDWKSIEIRAEPGEDFARAVKVMRGFIGEGKLPEARIAFEEAVALDPNQAPYLEWADTLAERGDIQTALALYRVALADPKKQHGFTQGSPPPTWVMRYCLLLLRAGDRKAADEAYQWGFDLTLNYLVFEGLRELFDLKPMRRTVDAKTLQAAAHTIIGLTNIETRTWDEFRMPPNIAIAEFRKALAAKPDFDVACIFLGKAYQKKASQETGSRELAIAAWQNAKRSADKAVRGKAEELLQSAVNADVPSSETVR